MQVVYCLQPAIEIELSASRDEYVELASLIVAGQSGTISLQPVSDPAPYHGFLNRLSVMPLPGMKVRLELCADTKSITVSGGVEWLDIFASSLKSFGIEARLDTHEHVDYFPGQFYLDPSSHPLVCAFSGQRNKS